MNYHFARSGNNFVLGFEEIGVYVSASNGSSWQQANSGFVPASTIDNCMVTVSSDLWTGTHSDGVYVSRNGGSTWSKAGTPNPLDTLSNSIVFAMLNPSPGILLAGTCGPGLYRSVDTGATWTHIKVGLPQQAGTGITCINSLAKAGSNIIAATTEGIYYSADNGLSWHPTNFSSPDYYVNGLVAQGNIACAGLVNNVTFQSGIYRSVNSGLTWAFVPSGAQDVVSMAGNNAGHFYAGTYTDNWVSADTGKTWNSAGPGIPSGVGGFCILALDSEVFIGNNAGIYYSEDYGASFTDVSDGLDPYPNNAIQGFATDGINLFAGTFADGVWRRPLAEMGGEMPSAQTGIPDELNGLQVFPNPASSSVVVAYSLTDNSNVSIELMDACGTRVINVVKQKQAAGRYQLRLNVQEIATGIYFLRLKTDNACSAIPLAVTR